jgi:hypothetical protein
VPGSSLSQHTLGPLAPSSAGPARQGSQATIAMFRKRSIFKGPTSNGSSSTGHGNSNGGPSLALNTSTPPPTSYSSDSTKTPTDILPSPLARTPRHVADASTDSDPSPSQDPERGQALHHRHSPSLRSIHEVDSLAASQAKHRSIRRSLTPQPSSAKSHLHIPGFGRRQKSAEQVRPPTAEPTLLEAFDSTDDLTSATSTRPTTARSVTDSQVALLQGSANMTSFPMGPPPTSRGTTFQENSRAMYAGGGPGTGPMMMGPGGPTNPGAVYQHIHDMASKRISTLDYLRKACVADLVARCARRTGG